MATSVVFPRAQFFANNGKPLIGGRIHTYVAGSSTRAATYKDAAKTQSNTNPILLDGRGEAAIYLAEGVEYKFVLEDSAGALILTQEPVYGAVWPNAAEWPSDATLSYRYMTEAKAVADAVSVAKFYATKTQAQYDAQNLPDDSLIEVASDESRDDARIRYFKRQGNVLEFAVNLDQLRQDMTRPTGAEPVGGFESYADFDSYTGPATRVLVIGAGIEGNWRKTRDESKSPNVGTVRRVNGEIWERENATPVKPEWFGASAQKADNTQELNAAFATGMPLFSDATFKASGVIVTRGQAVSGAMKIESSRIEFAALPAKSDPIAVEFIRMVYVESAYDFAEFLAIKSLGFNTINHYCYFANHADDAAGTIAQMLDNAASAGLKVVLGTESPEAHASLSNFVNSTKNHSAVIGYAAYDEPWGRNITVEQQNAKIASLRALTTKFIVGVDFMEQGGPFVKRLSTEYDIFFVNSYSLAYVNGNADDHFLKDLEKMRKDFGCIKAMRPASRIYPAFSAFSANAYYAGGVEQVVRASKEFFRTGGGNYAAFVWDGYGDATVTKRIKDTAEYQELSLSASFAAHTAKTDAFLFGGISGDHWPLTPLMIAMTADKLATTDNVLNSFPVHLKTGASETDRTTLTPAINVSGLGFKGSAGIYSTNIMTSKYLSGYVEVFSTHHINSGSFNVIGSNDSGYTYDDTIFVAAVNGNQTMEFSSATKTGRSVSFQSFDAGNYALYRRFLRGLVVSTNW